MDEYGVEETCGVDGHSREGEADPPGPFPCLARPSTLLPVQLVL